MKRLLILCGGVVVGFFLIKNYSATRPQIPTFGVKTTTDVVPSERVLKASSTSPGETISSTSPRMTVINLAVPYLSQMPDGLLVKPWLKACEEATIAMIEQFYAGVTASTLPKEKAKEIMNGIFAWENKNIGYNDDTDASTTARIINEYSSFSAFVKRNPTLEEIKNELNNNHPVISLHYGKGLSNQYLHFKANGPVYHVLVLKGYDDESQEFIVHDPGTYQYSGDNYRYSYATIMNSLHDYDVSTKKAINGTPTVLFTREK